MKERIQKILSARGLTSRRAAEKLLLEGRITVNGIPAKLGDQADPNTDLILIDGKKLPLQPEPVWLMLYKPRGYVTTLHDEKGRKTAASLVDCGCRVYPVGRLDYASEGLLLFTNDGALANALMHPRHGIPKVYEVTVRGELEHAEERLTRPIVLDGRPIRPPQVRLLRQKDEKASFEITIHEGRNRQIRRMCEAAGLEVLRLCRVQEGSLRLGTLRPGKWRYLTEEELFLIKQEVQNA
ncbi:MAG: rRNA pseudouridine synthase [Oscillospiraceae bacterium]|nr:rRNA pseudouridine synthase [Oscillospiraceae bacterium]